MTRMVTLTATLIIAALALASLATAEVPQTVNYQGRLTDGSGPVTATVAMTFTIYDAVTSGNSKWTETHPSVSVTDGLFNVVLGAGTPAMPVEDTVFSGADRWLEITVGGEIITPRTKMASNPYAFQSNWTLVGDVLYTSGEWGIARAGNALLGIGGADDGHVNLGVACTTGTTGLIYRWSTVSGGYRNRANGEMSTVSGGGNSRASELYSTVGGGFNNHASQQSSTVVGGETNLASGAGSTVGGGSNNTASGGLSIVSGGGGNDATEAVSTVSGGEFNTASGEYATVPGGSYNEASGRFSFAAGRRAKAVHNGSFVWADTTNADFSSSYTNQFKVRAGNGAYFDVTNPDLYYGLYVYSSDWEWAGRLANFWVEDSVGRNTDMLQIKVASNSHDDMQFIECERGDDFKFRVWGNGDVTADGTFTPGGADFAELVAVASGYASVEAGDVLVINPNRPETIVRSSESRSTLVAGIYSTQPGVLASSHEWDKVAADLGLSSNAGDDGEAEAESYRVSKLAAMLDEVPLAVVGIVPCKVSAENGLIQPGDLLVTSDTPGHAMRDDSPKTGTVLGKALGSLSSGTGVIQVLVTLQ